LTARHGFRATRHHFEITGLCRQCSAADGQRRRKNIF
jgi:Fe2+ or Zn2+ uptake regulation protein